MTDKTWWSRRREAFLDNLIFYLAVLGAGALVGFAAAFGTEDATLPLWLVVLFGVVQVGTVIALGALSRRRGGAVSVSFDPPPHPHAALLARVRALDSALGGLDPDSGVHRRIAETFNDIRHDALAATRSVTLNNMDEYKVEPGQEYSFSGTLGALRLELGQIETIVEHSRG